MKIVLRVRTDNTGSGPLFEVWQGDPASGHKDIVTWGPTLDGTLRDAAWKLGHDLLIPLAGPNTDL